MPIEYSKRIKSLLGIALIPALFTLTSKAFSSDQYVGTDTCKTCHEAQHSHWQGSHHDWAMKPANKQTVLGDFNNVTVEFNGYPTRFFTKENTFFVETKNADNKNQTFHVEYTFGVYPLQQYLLAFPDGRYQALTIAWDARPNAEGGQRWFDLYPEEDIQPDDPLHWTGTHFNWNSRCAACHSTDLQRNYNEETNTYKTSWAEINVGCEACHGPAQEHIKWTKTQTDRPFSGFEFSLNPVGNWIKEPGAATAHYQTTHSQTPNAQAQNAICGSCHSRRAQLSDALPKGKAALDYNEHYQIALMDAPLYHADGQIQEEVFVMGSFIQSKMFHAGVTCSNCHEPHSLKLRLEGNNLCAQCHEPSVFDQPSHHHHQIGSEGAACVNCHMPQTEYMVVDPRADHSLRIPRPDLSTQTNAPDACTQCHTEQQPSWAAKAINNWLETSQRKLPNDAKAQYATTMAAVRNGQAPTAAILQLIQLAELPNTLRATALAALPADNTGLKAALENSRHEDPYVRMRALSFFEHLPAQQRGQYLAPFLKDPAKIVRTEVARLLADVPATTLSEPNKRIAQNLFAEYITTQNVNADTHEAQMNLALFYSRRGNLSQAKTHYLTAIKLAPYFPHAYVNYADLQRHLGEEKAAQQTLLKATQKMPKADALQYALGLSYVRQKEYSVALTHLQQAVLLDQHNETYVQAYAMILDHFGKREQAIKLIQAFLAQQPSTQLDRLLNHWQP